MNRFELIELDESAAKSDSIIHTALKPYMERDWKTDSVFGYFDEKKYYYAFGRKLLRDHLIEIKGKDFNLTLDALWDLQMGWDFADTTNFKDSVRIFNNTRGLIIQADLGKSVSFQTSIYENQSRFPLHYQNWIDSTGVIPGQGRVKVNQDAGWDYSSSVAMLSVHPTKWLDLQIGHGKHFIGHGYRSMLLSDNAFNYPYLKSTLNLFNNQVQYMWMYAGLQDLQRLPIGDVPEALFKKKGANFYYVNWIPHPRVEIGVYEAIIWNDWNDSTGTEPFNYQQIIPLIGINTMMEMKDSSHHAVIGINGKLKITDQLQIYGQVVNDYVYYNGETKPNLGWQVGLKSFNLFVENLDLQFEINSSANISNPNLMSSQETFSHTNQSLSHPLSNSFQEMVGIINYRYNRMFVQAKGNLQQKDFMTGAEINRKSEILDLQIGIHMNPITNMNIALGWVYRHDQTINDQDKTQWIYLAFRTSLQNKYWDL